MLYCVYFLEPSCTCIFYFWTFGLNVLTLRSDNFSAAKYVFPLGRNQKCLAKYKNPVFLENGVTIIFTVVQQYISFSMDDLSIVYLHTAQPISQPPDVTNNAKSTRQADRVGHYAPAHISSVRMNNSGNISGLQDDGKCLLRRNQILFGIVK